MVIRAIKGKHLGQTSYVLSEGDHVLVVDCGFDVSILEKWLNEGNYKFMGIFLTHGHFDHAISGKELLAKGYTIYANENADRLTMDGNDMGKYLGVDFQNFSVKHKLRDNEVLTLGNFHIQTIYTPGHTVDGMCYLINGVLFSGDTLLSGAYGRVDLPTASEQDMRTSLKRLLSLDKKTIVCSGHEHTTKGLNLFAPKRTVGDYVCSQDIVYFLQNE